MNVCILQQRAGEFKRFFLAAQVTRRGSRDGRAAPGGELAANGRGGNDDLLTGWFDSRRASLRPWNDFPPPFPTHEMRHTIVRRFVGRSTYGDECRQTNLTELIRSFLPMPGRYQQVSCDVLNSPGHALLRHVEDDSQGADVIISTTLSEATSLGWLIAISRFGREHLRAQPV